MPANRQASLTIHNADTLTALDRKRVAEWLRSAARTMTKKRNLFVRRFRATLYR